MKVFFNFLVIIFISLFLAACSAKDVKELGSNASSAGALGLIVGGTLYGIGSLMEYSGKNNLSDVQKVLTSNGFKSGEPYITVLKEANVETVADYSYYLENIRVDLKGKDSLNCRIFKEIDDNWILDNEYNISDEKKFNTFKQRIFAYTYEFKLNVCIKSKGINDFNAQDGNQWNREDIQSQLKECHIEIKKG